MGKAITLRRIPEGYDVKYFKHAHEESNGRYKTMEQVLDGVRNFFDKPDMPLPGSYHVKVKKCYMRTPTTGHKYGMVEFEVTSGKYKGRTFFSILAGGFDIKVEYNNFIGKHHCVVTEIHQDQDIKFKNRKQELCEGDY